jgi:hypothetical protein
MLVKGLDHLFRWKDRHGSTRAARHNTQGSFPTDIWQVVEGVVLTGTTPEYSCWIILPAHNMVQGSLNLQSPFA